MVEVAGIEPACF